MDYFDGLIGWEPFRASQFGIQHRCTIALNPKEANDPRCREVLDVLPRYLAKDRVVAVGEIGYDSMTPDEDEVFAAQLALAVAHDLPALVHTPHRDKVAGTQRSLDVVAESAIEPGRVVLDHLNELTVRTVRDSGCWAGFSIYPDTKMSPDRMVAILSDYGPGADAGELGRRLGTLGSAADRGHGRGDAGARDSPRMTWTSCCGAIRSSSTDSPVVSTSTTDEPHSSHVRGQLDPSGWLMRMRPSGRDAPSTSPTAPTCTRPRIWPACCPNWTASPNPSASGWTSTCSVWACGWPRRSRPAWPPIRPPGDNCATSSTSVASKWSPSTAFPYKAFQAPVVKYDVYYPDWTDPRRLAYTLDLAAVLIDLMPDDAVRGSISTLPLAWREPWGPAEVAAAREQTDLLATSLARQARTAAGTVRVAFEPEPGCVVETTWQAVKALSDVDHEYLGVCVDLAHLACAWEDPAAGDRQLRRRRPARGEVPGLGRARGHRPGGDRRRACRLRRTPVPAPDPQRRRSLVRRPARGAASRPRQARRAVAGAFPRTPARAGRATTALHHPRTAGRVAGPASAASTAHTDHLEVETYTWGVLPPEQRPHDDASLVRGIAAELAFTRSELIALGLADLRRQRTDER